MCKVPVSDFRLTSDTFEDNIERVIVSCPVVVCNWWTTVPEFTNLAELGDLVQEHRQEGLV